MIKMTDILKEIIESKPWAFYIDSEDDWMLLSNLLKQKGYKFASGYTFSDRDLVDFNPFKSDRPFGDDGSEDDDFGYSYAMSYPGKYDVMVIQKPNKNGGKLYFDSCTEKVPLFPATISISLHANLHFIKPIIKIKEQELNNTINLKYVFNLSLLQYFGNIIEPQIAITSKNNE